VYGGLRFFERAEVKHALSYLRLVENPNDDTSFLRVVNFPTRGIGSRTIEQLQDAARQSGRSLYQSVGSVGGKGGGNLAAFTALVDRIRERTRGLTLREIIAHMLAETGLIDFYRADKDGADRVENLEELMNAAEAFVTQEGFGRDAVALPVDELSPGTLAQRTTSRDVPGLVLDAPVAPDAETGEIMSPLAAFLTHASLEAGDNQAQAGQDAIQLMTIHSAKGLEFDSVFITGLEEGLFPHENSLQTTDGLEEERRLMYVAITRARKRLYLTFSQTRLLHGQTRYNVKSRFVEELPEANVRWITPRHQAFGSGHAREYRQAWERGAGAGGMIGAARVESTTAVPKAMEASRAATGNGHKFRSGQSVFHTKFGEGVIVTLEGNGEEARAQVNFGRHGMKWLALSVAKLQPVD
jgi:DNA helicase-2/ATP-dependent DNA helicase PcrA